MTALPLLKTGLKWDEMWKMPGELKTLVPKLAILVSISLLCEDTEIKLGWCKVP